METVDNRTLKQKWHDFWVRMAEKKDRFLAYCKENPDTVFGVLVVAIPVIGKILLGLLRLLRNLHDDWYDKTDYYDPRTGEHWYVRRPLTNREKLNLERRYNNGESKGSILHSMGLM